MIDENITKLMSAKRIFLHKFRQSLEGGLYFAVVCSEVEQLAAQWPTGILFAARQGSSH